MTVLPEPVPLDDPPGRPEALLDAAVDLTAAAVLLDDLAGGVRTASAPGWRGADADALAARCGRVALVAGDVSDALRRAARRCTDHAELWRTTSAGIAALREEQETDHAEARLRMASPTGLMEPANAGADAVLGRLAAAEAARRVHHAALRARLTEDAGATAHVLHAAADEVGVRGGSAASVETVATLAGRLPGWGAPQLAMLGRELGELLREDSRDAERLARQGLPAASGAAHAAALMAALGPDGVRWLLSCVAAGLVPPTGAVVELLSRSLADVGESGVPSWLPGLVGEAGIEPSPVVTGLAAVLAAGLRHSPRPAPDTLLVAWGRSLLEAERSSREPSGAHQRPTGSDPATSDPVHLVVDALVRQGSPSAAAELLRRSDDWATLLGRAWNDGGEVLGELVGLAAGAADDEARTALRSGLVALGTGLADGHRDGWPALEIVVQTVAPHLVGALARHVDLLTTPLGVGAEGVVDTVSETALRGLARVSVEEGARFDRLTDALELAVTVRPHAFGPLPGQALAVVVLPASLLAVREHGHRLLHAVEENVAEDEAASKADFWDDTGGVVVDVLGGKAPVAGIVIGGAEAAYTRLMGLDGHRESRPDRGPRHTAWEAAARVDALLVTTDVDVRAHVAEEARRAFTRTGHVLGVPVPRSTPDVSFGRAVAEGALSGSLSRSDLERLGRLPGRGMAGVLGGVLGSDGG